MNMWCPSVEFIWKGNLLITTPLSRNNHEFKKKLHGLGLFVFRIWPTAQAESSWLMQICNYRTIIFHLYSDWFKSKTWEFNGVRKCHKSLSNYLKNEPNKQHDAIVCKYLKKKSSHNHLSHNIPFLCIWLWASAALLSNPFLITVFITNPHVFSHKVSQGLRR